MMMMMMMMMMNLIRIVTGARRKGTKKRLDLATTTGIAHNSPMVAAGRRRVEIGPPLRTARSVQPHPSICLTRKKNLLVSASALDGWMDGWIQDLRL
mmetsp:Transcript_27535/g.46213  ORF Transcript_27535/g.46213 Transcript_27535/m.46213 type:complete len:97 (+) Transcript_27535:3-293(+)